jgi:hypothetical protein
MPVALLAELSNLSENGRVLFMGSMREIEPKNVYTGVKQLTQDGWSARRWSDRGHDFCAN